MKTNAKDRIVLCEYNGAVYNGTKYELEGKNRQLEVLESQGASKSYFSLKSFFTTVFLPEGYPNSVSEDYATYQIWDTIQAFCSSISGALAARAMFETIGVGDEQATVYGATLTWLIKDGTGMIGRIVFAWSQGSSLDSNSKMWRLYADILNDLSFLIDLTTPFFARAYSIYFVSCSSLLRSLVGVAGGATRSALTQHQAKQNNLADVSAKDGSQETLVNLVALVFNLLLLSYVKDAKMLIWQLFFLFVCGHLYANYRAVTCLVMKTFNRNRFHIVCRSYLRNDRVLEPAVANKMEPVLRTVSRVFRRIDLSTSITNIRSTILVPKNLSRFNEQHYLIDFDLNKRSANVIFEEKISLMDQVKCLLQIEIAENALEFDKGDEFRSLRKAILDKDCEAVEHESYLLAEQKFDEFVKLCEKQGWSFSYVQFQSNQYRYSFEKFE